MSRSCVCEMEVAHPARMPLIMHLHSGGPFLVVANELQQHTRSTHVAVQSLDGK